MLLNVRCLSFLGPGESAMRRGSRVWGHGLHLSQAGVGRAQRWGGTRQGLQQRRPLHRSEHTHTHTNTHRPINKSFIAPFHPVNCSAQTHSPLRAHRISSSSQLVKLSSSFLDSNCQHSRFLLESSVWVEARRLWDCACWVFCVP